MRSIIDLQIAVSCRDIPNLSQFQAWVDAALPPELSTVEVTIRLVDIEEGTHLNQSYRHKLGPTNILSFPFNSMDMDLPIPLLGDLVICTPVLEREASEMKKNLYFHWAHLVIHGILHLLGYDHVENEQAIIMENKEIDILRKLGYPNPYGEVE